MSIDPDRAELLDALLDGELSPEQAAEVRAWVDSDPEAAAELAATATVRDALRSLEPVEPPFGLFERLARPKVSWAVGPLAGAVAAASLLVVGFVAPGEPPTSPPVDTFAQRHQAVVSVGAVAEAPPSEIATAGFASLTDAELDAMGGGLKAPAELGDEWERTGGFADDAGTLHVVYSNGRTDVSVYTQHGSVAWEQLPDTGRADWVLGAPAWTRTEDDGETMVLERSGLVYTFVGSGPHEEVMEVVAALPAPLKPTAATRLDDAASDVVSRFGILG